jgi:hypothetical protein
MLIADVDEEEDGHQTTENYNTPSPEEDEEEEEDGHQTTENYNTPSPEEDEEEDGHQTTENYNTPAPEEDEEEDGHQTTENYNTPAPEEVAITVKKTRKCSLCGQCGHNKATCGVKQSAACQELAPLFDSAFDNYKPMKRKITCSLCSENGHNSRTCSLKCSPCSDQVARSYCFANLSATKATSMARILECSSIYDEK